jgi:hypothetical protein
MLKTVVATTAAVTIAGSSVAFAQSRDDRAEGSRHSQPTVGHAFGRKDIAPVVELPAVFGAKRVSADAGGFAGKTITGEMVLGGGMVAGASVTGVETTSLSRTIVGSIGFGRKHI